VPSTAEVEAPFEDGNGGLESSSDEIQIPETCVGGAVAGGKIAGLGEPYRLCTKGQALAKFPALGQTVDKPAPGMHREGNRFSPDIATLLGRPYDIPETVARALMVALEVGGLAQA
jgi:hypothetical protein